MQSTTKLIIIVLVKQCLFLVAHQTSEVIISSLQEISCAVLITWVCHRGVARMQRQDGWT